ncbi:sulfatase [Myxosarcina sp. GI1]|uniref:sulfatase family protein n=1 Tax=Myxosarcina sp. GI1 TaxID=1541065 RepID=UPI00155AED90|nr:sulfatase [Myxosarcina sp. GI1]
MLTIAIVSCNPFRSSNVDRLPNILFILTDDLDTASVGYMPHLKSLLIDRGVSFSNYFVNVSLCCPSRATMLRGQYAHNTGVFTNHKLNGSFIYFYRRGLERSTIATWLQKQGYRTAYMGKYLNGYPRRASKTYVPPGWDEWDSPIYDTGYLEYNYTLNENGNLVRYRNRPQDYSADVYTDKARKFITQSIKDKQPFFVFLSYFAPHQPAIPAPRHRHLFSKESAPRIPSFNETDVSDKPKHIRNLPLLNRQQQNKIDRLYRQRLRSLQAVDEGLVKLINTLKINKQLDNTYIIFTSDNGFHLGQHRLPPEKETAYEEDIHLPLYLRGAGIPAGKIIDEIVGNIDLAPTIAKLAGANVPNFVDGRSLVELWRDNSRSLASWRRVFLVEHRQNKQMIPMIPDYIGLRTSNCTYIEYDNGDRELYDLTRDPYQLQNIAKTTKPEVIKEYARRSLGLRNCRGKICRELDRKPISDCV